MTFWLLLLLFISLLLPTLSPSFRFLLSIHVPILPHITPHLSGRRVSPLIIFFTVLLLCQRYLMRYRVRPSGAVNLFFYILTQVRVCILLSLSAYNCI